MTDAEKRIAAKVFSTYWQERSDEKQETQFFGVFLLQKVYGIKEPDKYIRFEVPVKIEHKSFINGVITTLRERRKTFTQQNAICRLLKRLPGDILFYEEE